MFFIDSFTRLTKLPLTSNCEEWYHQWVVGLLRVCIIGVVNFSNFFFCTYCCCWVFKSCATLLQPLGLSMGFFIQEYWKGLSFPSSGVLPTWIEPEAPAALQVGSLLLIIGALNFSKFFFLHPLGGSFFLLYTINVAN